MSEFILFSAGGGRAGVLVSSVNGPKWGEALMSSTSGRRICGTILAEMSPTLALAGPVVLAELGWMAMGVVDTVIVGGLGAEAIGAVGLGSIAFFTTAVFGMGLLLGLDTLVSQAFGAGDLDDCRRSLAQGVLLALAMTAPLMGVVLLAIPPLLAAMGVEPGVLRETLPYLRASSYGTLPLLIYAAFRRYLQAVGHVAPVMFALLSANLVNALGVWALVYGRLGLPTLGIEGAGWATSFSRVYMAAVLIAVALWHDRRSAGGPGFVANLRHYRPDAARLRRLVELGLPAALQLTLEVGVFGAVTALAGRLDASSLAAHQVVLQVSSVTFMIPLGLGSAGAVRVGRAIGRRDLASAARAGWATLVLTAAFMISAGVVITLVPRLIISGFTSDPAVAALAVPLLFVAAGFQLFDGVQGVTTGNLRGTGDTRVPMLCHALAFWAIGLPTAYALAFPLHLGVLGLWLGLSLGLGVAGCILLGVWIKKTHELTTSSV